MSPCRGATAPLLRLPPWCRHFSLPSSASNMMVIPSVGRLPGAECCLATPFSALTVSSCSRSSLEQTAGGCPACCPCLFPLHHLDVQGHHGASPSCPCTSRRHRTSRADAGATSTASLWSGHGNRAGKEREPGGKNEVVLACGRKFCLEVESPTLLIQAMRLFLRPIWSAETFLGSAMRLSLQEKDATHPIEGTRNQHHRSKSSWIGERNHCADHLGLLNG